MIELALHHVKCITVKREQFYGGPVPFDVIYVTAEGGFSTGTLVVKFFVKSGAKVGLTDEEVSNG